MGTRFVDSTKGPGKARSTGEPAGVGASTTAKTERAAIEETMALAITLPTEDRALHAFVQEAVGKVLLRRGIPTADLQTPDKHIYVPAVDALRYASSAEAIINIIAASMCRETAHRVLPSYIELVKQISLDELELIRRLPKPGRSTPITHVNLVFPTNHVVMVYRNVLPEAVAATCEFKDNIPQYIDNLTRLGVMVFRPEDEASTSTYRAIARLKFVKQILAGAPEGSRIAMSPSAIALTDLGEGLRRACFD